MSTSKNRSVGQEDATISQALRILQEEFEEIPTVTSWSVKMGYEDPTSFSDDFRRAFGRRPQPVLLAFRTRKAMELLREEQLTNYEIARKLKLRNEKGLYQFVKNQTGYAPNTIASLPDEKYQALRKKLDKKI